MPKKKKTLFEMTFDLDKPLNIESIPFPLTKKKKKRRKKQ